MSFFLLFPQIVILNYKLNLKLKSYPQFLRIYIYIGYVITAPLYRSTVYFRSLLKNQPVCRTADKCCQATV